MANRKVTINIDTTANVSGAKQASAAMDNLAASSNKVSTAGQAAGKEASRVGQLAGQAGFQIQDFAVQVGAGTSALTAFSQQAPQLLGAFGPAGAIAGAIVAIGAIATKVFLTMASDAEGAGKAAEEMGEKMLEAFKKAGGDAADATIEKIELQRTKTDILRDSANALIEVQNNKIKSDQELAKSQSKMTEEALKYLEATGQIKSAEEAIIALRKQTAEADKDAAIAEIEVGVQAQRNLYEQIREQKRNVQEDADKAQARVNELQAKQAELTKRINDAQDQDRKVRESLSGDPISRMMRSAPTPSLDTTRAEAELVAIQEQIQGIQKFIEKVPSKIGSLTASAFEQGGRVDKAVAEGQIAIEALEAEFNTAAKTEAIKQTVTDLTAGVKEIGTEIAKFEPVNEIQKAAKESIMAAVSDGELTAREQQNIGSALQILMGTLKTGQGTTLKSLQELITLNNELTSKVAAQNNAIQNLRVRINSLALPQR